MRQANNKLRLCRAFCGCQQLLNFLVARLSLVLSCNTNEIPRSRHINRSLTTRDKFKYNNNTELEYFSCPFIIDERRYFAYDLLRVFSAASEILKKICHERIGKHLAVLMEYCLVFFRVISHGHKLLLMMIGDYGDNRVYIMMMTRRRPLNRSGTDR
jgi:hypothetical protein